MSAGLGVADPLGLTDPGLVRDPYPAYAALRADGGVHYAPRWDSWFVTRDDLCRDVLAGPVGADPNGQPLLRMLQAAVLRGATSWRPPAIGGGIGVDELHRLQGRRTTALALGADGLDRLWPGFAAACADTAAVLVERVGPVDLVRDYAIPLATSLLADLMAVAPQDRAVFRAWAESSYHDDLDEEAMRRLVRDVRQLLARQAVDRLRCPADDFVGRLASGPAVLSTGGREVTAHLEFVLGTGLMVSLVTHQGLVLSFSTLLHALVAYPDQYRLLHRDPALLAGTVEEGLRYDTATQAVGRRTAGELVLDGRVLPAGALLVLCTGSANRDPAQWPDANRFDVTRAPRSTARHLAFGRGSTACLGAAMSRRALWHMLEPLVGRVREIAAAPEARRFPEFMTRGFTTLPVDLVVR